VHWLTMHGVLRSAANWSARKGDPQARFFADPTLRADPIPFFEELRAQGPLVRARVSFLTVDHATAHDLLRSEDFRVVSMGGSLPSALRWLERRTRADVLHPLLPPSLPLPFSFMVRASTATDVLSLHDALPMFEVSGSAVVEVMVAVLVSDAAWPGAVTTMVNVVEAPVVKVARVELTAVLPAFGQEQPA